MAGIRNQPALADLPRLVRETIATTAFSRTLLDDTTAAAFLTTLGIANHDSIVVSANGEAINTEQPAFQAQVTSNILNVTGNGTTYTIVWDAETFDQNADFDGTSTFTAPVTGKYLLSIFVFVSGVVAANRADLIIVTSNRSYTKHVQLPAVDPSVVSLTILADMDAADTCTITIRVQGEGSDLIDISDSSFTGVLIA